MIRRNNLFKNILTTTLKSFCNEQIVGYNILRYLVKFCENILTNSNMTSVDVNDALNVIVKLSPYV